MMCIPYGNYNSQSLLLYSLVKFQLHTSPLEVIKNVTKTRTNCSAITGVDKKPFFLIFCSHRLRSLLAISGRINVCRICKLNDI